MVILVVIVGILIILFGFHVMKRLDNFLYENEKHLYRREDSEDEE